MTSSLAERTERPGAIASETKAAAAIDVLLLQLGTPDSPTAKALRPYLRQFLSDPRVLEMPALQRWLLVNFVIVPFRAPKSAVKYRRIWNKKTGSPLLEITRRQTAALQDALGDGFRVQFAMRYGSPSIHSVIERMSQRGCDQLVVVPMFPQYSATTTASGLDALFDSLKEQRIVPSLRIIRDYHDDPGYLNAVMAGIRRSLTELAKTGREPDLHILSFHGIPLPYVKRGDPYQRQANVTAKLIARAMGWSKGEWKLCFQSRLGRTKWLMPYTDETLRELGANGVKRVLIAQPGFTADCLETIDEIGHEGRLDFLNGGGQELIHVPCVNDDPEFIAALKNLVLKEADHWR